MSECSGIPTLQSIKDAGTNAEVFNEVVTSSATETTKTDSKGKKHLTLAGIEAFATNGYKGEWTPSTDVEIGAIYGYQSSEWRSLTGVSGVAPVEGNDWRNVSLTESAKSHTWYQWGTSSNGDNIALPNELYAFGEGSNRIIVYTTQSGVVMGLSPDYERFTKKSVMDSATAINPLSYPAVVGASTVSGGYAVIGDNYYQTYPSKSGIIESINYDYNEIKLVGDNDPMVWFDVNSTSECRFKNNALIAEAARKLHMHEPLSVAWYGDSNSALNDGQVQKSFAAMINNSYGSGTVTVVNRAVSGRTAEWEFKAYLTAPNSQLSVIALGTNDGIYERYLNGFDEIKSYEVWMRKLIEREIEWGAGVVIVSPLPVRFDKQFESYATPAPTDPFGDMARPDIKELRGVAERLAKEYSCPFFDSEEWMSRYNDDAFEGQTQSIGGPQTPFGDSIHLKQSYAIAWGNSIAMSVMCDNLISPQRVTGGSLLQVRPNIDPVVFSGGKGTFHYTWGGNVDVRFASGDSFLNERALVIQAGEKLTYTFYVSKPVICYPVIVGVSGGATVIAYDQYSVLGQPSVDVDKVRRTKTGFNGSSDVSINAGWTVTTKSLEKPCNIYSAGWHSITFTSASDGVAWISGLVFDSMSVAVENIRLKFDEVQQSRDITTIPDSDNVANYKTTGSYFAGLGVGGKFWGNNSALVEVHANEFGTLVFQTATEISGDVYFRTFTSGAWTPPRKLTAA